MMSATHWSANLTLLLLLLVLTAGCGKIEGGPDALSSNANEPYGGSPLACTTCHASGSALDPVLLNGSGTAGKHLEHVQQARIPCTRCHADYYWSPTHLNGRFDVGEPGVRIVRFDTVNPSGDWEQDAGPGTESCASTYCHGASSTLAWYGTETVTCTTCHYGTAAINPFIINGSGTQGKHVKHVGEKGYACQTCHEGYDRQETHVNGTLDAGNPAVKLVFFDGMNPSGDWTQNTGAQTGDCADTYCHGATNGVVTVPNTPAWYTTTPLGCTGCHSTGSFINPLLINGSGTAGKHVKHVTERGLGCEMCHDGYIGAGSHVNGLLETGNVSLGIVAFNATNPAGDWTTGGSGSGSCGSTACHGGDNMDWYIDNPTWTLPPCSDCHAGLVVTRRMILDTSGDFGPNIARISHHVAGSADPTPEQCQVCHAMDHHMGGTVRLRQADTDAAIVYDPATPATLEPFCLSCHDTDGASATFVAGGSALGPFNDGQTLGQPPYPYATSIAESWAKAYGHGPNGNHAPAARLTCAGSGAPGTGCHGNDGAINAHGSTQEVLGTHTFFYSVNTGDGPYNEAWFALCFDCHANYPGVTKEDTLGVKQGGILDNLAWFNGCTGCHGGHTMYQLTGSLNPPYYTAGVTTHFADHNEAGDPFGLNDDTAPWFAVEPNRNLHWFHLGMYVSEFRGGSYALVVCVNCHDVHGSNTPYGAVYDPLGYTHVTGPGWSYGQMTGSAYGASSILSGYPTYCGMNCHELSSSPTRAWFSPIVEGP